MINWLQKQHSLKQYSELPVEIRTSDPLTYWKTRQNLLPNLSRLELKYLCVTATSVPSERIFSKTGNIITDNRNRLKPNLVNELVFLSALPKL